MGSTFRRYRRQPAAQPGTPIFFDSKGRMLDVQGEPQHSDFAYYGRVIETDDQGMLIAFDQGHEPPERS